jgi:hypothetical protein
VLEFIEFPAFTTRLMALARHRADDVLREVQNDLLENPKRGLVIEGTSGVPKSRAADPIRGKGKSGGLRYMYYYIERDGQIFLLMVFNKDEQDNLTQKQKKTLSNLIRELREEGQ